MAKDSFKITKKLKVKGEDGNKVISVRIKDSTVAALDDIAKKTARSRNEVINIMLEHAIQNIEIETE